MLVNRSTHSLWRSTIDDHHHLTTSGGSSPPGFLAPHPSDFTSSHGNISSEILEKYLFNFFIPVHDDDDDLRIMLKAIR